MQDTKHIIEPERMGTWLAVMTIISILALGLSMVALKRLHDTTVITQAEILVLTNKVKTLEQKASPVQQPQAQTDAK